MNSGIDRAEGEGAAVSSFGDNNPVPFGIRDYALVVSVARPSWPIEKREPVALQSSCKGVDGGPRTQLHTQVGIANELARALCIRDPLDVLVGASVPIARLQGTSGNT